MKKDILKNIVLLLMTCAIFFVIVEAGFKVLHVFSDPEVSPSAIEGLPYENTPNGWFLRYQPSNGWVFYRSNSLGMRDVERAFGKKEGVKRVVCLGDSIMFGGEVPFDRIFSRRLEAMLNKDHGTDIEVLNCGVTSYSVREYSIYLEKKALKFDPDLVVVGICLNDYRSLFDEGRKDTGDTGGDVGERLARSRTLLSRVKRFLFHSYFLEYMRLAFKTLSPSKDQAVNEYAQAEDPESWGAAKRYFIRLKELCDARGIEMIVVIFPYSEQLDSPTPDTQPQKYIRDMLRGLDIEYIDLLPAYAEHKAKGARIFSRFDKAHPLPPGHDLAAGMVREKIHEKNMLDI